MQDLYLQQYLGFRASGVLKLQNGSVQRRGIEFAFFSAAR